MAKGDKYLTPNDVAMRVHDGIVMYKGVPYYASRDEDSINGMRLNLYRFVLGGKPEANVDANDKHLDTSSLPIGYVNYISAGRRSAAFFQRGPWRRQKSTICPRSLQLIFPSWSSFEAVHPSQVYCQAFWDMLLDVYPKDRDFEMEQNESLAISRDIAVHQSGKQKQNIYYQTELIGSRRDRHDFFQVDAGFNHSIMVERLRNLGIPVN